MRIDEMKEAWRIAYERAKFYAKMPGGAERCDEFASAPGWAHMAWEWKMAARLIRRWQKKSPHDEEKVATIEGPPEAIAVSVGKESFVVTFDREPGVSLLNDMSVLDGLEKKLRDMGVTHCVDLDADNEPVLIDEFFKNWKEFVEHLWSKRSG